MPSSGHYQRRIDLPTLLQVDYFLILLGWLILTAIWGVAIESMLRRRDRAARKIRPAIFPHCGHCDYIVQGIPGHKCPECGKDLRIVGVEWATE